MSAEDNKALVRRWFEESDKGNFDTIDEFVSPEYVDYNPPLPGLPPGREGVRASSRMLWAAFSDVKHTIEEQIAEGDKVMTRLRVRARFTGPFMGFQPTGQVVEVKGIAVHRIRDGRFVEHWAQWDQQSFFGQLGAERPQPH
jgi:steroid delta-isomerase-like uncharacterized protein